MSIAPPPAAPPRQHLRLDRRSNGTLMSPRTFDAVSRWDERYRYELLRGVVIVSPAAGYGETTLNELLGNFLDRYRRSRGRRRVIDYTTYEAQLTTTQRRRADRAIWTGLGRLPDPERDFPTIVVEVVSRRRRDQRRDLEEKRHEYLTAGGREYWVFDRFRRTLTVFTPSVERVYDDKESYRTPLLPGLALPLAELFDAGGAFDRPRPRRPGPGGKRL